MVRASLTVIAGIGLIVAQALCAMTCSGGICSALNKSQSLPPCHRHHNHSNDQDPASCVHQNLASAAIVHQTVQVPLPNLPDLGAAEPPQPQAISAIAWANARYFSNSSPPGAKGISSVVLRI